MQLLTPLSLGPGGIILSWDFLASNWTTQPALAGQATSPVAGDVYSYTWGGTTRYRLVPSTYSAAQDAFYTTFSASTCSGLIIARG
jgi:hypothetical protein